MAQIQIVGFDEAIEVVQRAYLELPKIRQHQVIKSLARRCGNIIKRRARQTVPQPGYPGDKTLKNPDLKPLRDTIGVRVKNRQKDVLAIVEPMRPKGAHGYNVEHGHRIRVGAKRKRYHRGKWSIDKNGRRVWHRGQSEFYPGRAGYLVPGRKTAARKFMKKAFDDTKLEVQMLLRRNIGQAIKGQWRAMDRLEGRRQRMRAKAG